MKVIEVRSISKAYGDNLVLDEVSLEVRRGETIAIIGPSGSGKSTLLRCMNRLEEVDSGEIFIDGEPITGRGGRRLDQVRRRMGMVFQQFNLFPHLTVAGNITLAPVSLRMMRPDAARERARELLRQVGLEEKLDSWPDQLSGGQKQRVAIARALAMDPEVMLFDEPTSALDPEMVGEVLRVMRDLSEAGMTMLVVSHELAFVRQAATRVLFMDAGKLAVDLPPAELFDNPPNQRIRDFLDAVQQKDAV
ncbi:MAG: amino acid ABC transporter ATP-binding protein [Bacillota bacterium]|nr:amino acid ABC transporter ATP-binding protein [Bacillota bacterium]